MTNALGSATSPYLRQHADNPVHWQEWGPHVFAEARERDVPILLSIGYSSCHWCHVMAHESFEDPATAAVMNENFVCVKVDREERPDLDAVYMNATVAMTGQGGWPMTCFLTADAEPFYCGTYYPPVGRGGMPSLTQLLEAITDTWRNRREDVLSASASVVAELARAAGALPDGSMPVDAPLLEHAVAQVLTDEDHAHGGFGGAPKFPPAALLEGLLRHVERTGSEAAMAAVRRTAEAMARGGLNDQLSGGFARYCVDAHWVVPHFEKMLYDNALLLRFYGHLARLDGSGLALAVAEQTAGFLLSEMSTAEGGFASALDADTEGVEGSTYVWTPAQLDEELGAADGEWAARLLAVTDAGTFEKGASVLQLREDPDSAARWEGVRERLSAARARRPQPGRDDKVVTAWNGMAILALAEAGGGLGREEWISAAERCAAMVLDRHLIDGRLRRASFDGHAGAAVGVLEDYAFLASGLLALHQVTGEQDWLTAAQELLDTAIAHFTDPEMAGSWFDTADDAEELVHRPRDAVDGATPSGASAMAEALLTASAMVDVESSGRYRQLAEDTLTRAAVLLERTPRSAGNWLAVAEALQRGPVQIAVAHLPGDEELLRVARRWAPGGAVVVGGPRDATPLLADRPMIRDQATAYVCRHFVCDRPVTTVQELGELLHGDRLAN